MRLICKNMFNITSQSTQIKVLSKSCTGKCAWFAQLVEPFKKTECDELT